MTFSKWKHFPRYWPFVQGIHRSPLNSPHKGQWCGALIFSLICTWINGLINNYEVGDSICHHAHFDFTVVLSWLPSVNVKEALFQLNQSSDPLPDKGVRRLQTWVISLLSLLHVKNGQGNIDILDADTYIDRIVQQRCNPIANAPELWLSCTVSLIWGSWYALCTSYTDCVITIIPWQEMTGDFSGLMQEICNSSVLTKELRLSCNNQSI